MDLNKIKEYAKGYEKDMTAFLRAIVKNPGESCDEKAHVETIAAEMKKVGFDEVVIDPQGNVMGFMGTGDKIIAFDAHIDTVGIGNIDNWKFDPYDGYETETEIGGRGVSDQCGGIVSGVYGAKIMKDLGLIPEGYKVMVVGTVQEEDCDGLCWQYIINEDKIRPEFVSMLREFPVTVLLRSVETTQSTRWLTFFRMFVLLTRTMTLTRQRSKVLLKCLTRNSTLTTKRLVSLDVEQLQHLRSSTHHQAVVQQQILVLYLLTVV